MTTGGEGDFLKQTLRNLGVQPAEQRANQALEALAQTNPERAAAIAGVGESRRRRRRKKPVATGIEEQLAVLRSAPPAFPRPVYIGLEIQQKYAAARDILLASRPAVTGWNTPRVIINFEAVRLLMDQIRQKRALAASLEIRRREMAERAEVRREKGLLQAERFLEEVESGEREGTERQVSRAEHQIQETERQSRSKQLSGRFAIQMGETPGPLTYTDIAEEAGEYLVILEAARERLFSDFQGWLKL